MSDAEKILGIVHSENLLVTAEAYDVALELSPGQKAILSSVLLRQRATKRGYFPRQLEPFSVHSGSLLMCSVLLLLQRAV